MTLIAAERLTKRYGQVTAVDDVSFQLRPAGITGFLGANGAGKTTTLRMLLGLARPSSGRITIDGLSYRDLTDPMRRIGALVDPAVFHPGCRGRDALRIIARSGGIGDRRVDEVLELVELGDAGRRRVRGYSLGMRQRLALAAALLGDPAALVLDEPTNGLDPTGVHWLRGLLRGLADSGRTVVVSSHLLAELELVVDDVVVIHQGRLVAHEPLDQLRERTRSSSLEETFLALTTDVPKEIQR